MNNARTWETNAAEFAALDAGKGWPFAALVACSVQAAEHGGSRKGSSFDRNLTGKTNATAFASEALTTAKRVLAFLRAWDAAAELGLCPASSTLEPSDFETTAYPEIEFEAVYKSSDSKKTAAEIAEEQRKAAAEAERVANEAAERRVAQEKAKAEAEANRAIRQEQERAEREIKNAERKAEAERQEKIKADERAKAAADRAEFIAQQLRDEQFRNEVVKQGAEKLAAHINRQAEVEKAKARQAAEAERQAAIAKAQVDAREKAASAAQVETDKRVEEALAAVVAAQAAALRVLDAEWGSKPQPRLALREGQFQKVREQATVLLTWGGLSLNSDNELAELLEG